MVTNAQAWAALVEGVARYRRASPTDNLVALKSLAGTASTLRAAGNPYDRIAELEARIDELATHIGESDELIVELMDQATLLTEERDTLREDMSDDGAGRTETAEATPDDGDAATRRNANRGGRSSGRNTAR